MALPKSFKLLGHTIKIVARDDLYNEVDIYGRWTMRDLKIEVDTSQPESMQMHSLWHEVAHAFFDLCGYPALSKDEQLVDSIGGALAQITRTIK